MTDKSANSSYTYTIGGVKVFFPAKAYPSQLSMMDKVIRGCNKAQNCLLESPTGSGKTLALLCSSLSWQKAESKRLAKLQIADAKQQMEEKMNKEKRKVEKENMKKLQEAIKGEKVSENKVMQVVVSSPGTVDEHEKDPNDSMATKFDPDSDPEESGIFKLTPKRDQSPLPVESFTKRWFNKLSSTITVPLGLSSSSDNTNAIVPNESPNTTKSTATSSNNVPQEQNFTPSANVVAQEQNKNISDNCCDPDCNSSESNNTTHQKKSYRAPKIYFGTRTHKQIAQVVRELNKTEFAKDVKITILSSRNHTCVHPFSYRPDVNKTELCRQLLDPIAGTGCRFNANVPKFGGHDVLRYSKFPEVWDIEDLVNYGKKHSVCPYYMARTLVSTANIIFCPYNYLTDPLIRKSMNLKLKGEIIIVDEAHNIEDTCRESASFDLEQANLIKAIRDCEDAAKETHGQQHGQQADRFAQIVTFLNHINDWIDKNEDSVIANDYNQGTLTFSGFEALENFENHGFGKSAFEKYKANIACLLSSDKSEENANESMTEEETAVQPTVAGATRIVLEGLLLVLGFLVNDHYTDDYQVALTKLLVTNSSFGLANGPDEDGWFRMRKKQKPENHWKHTLHFWCLNPAVVFDEIKEKARCVILTSGTLSPIDSFQSELGTQFPIKLEANHVIGQSQCWVGSLGVGPNNISLNGVFTNTSTYEFQDELGELILKVCTFVPHGVLCFLPSYHLLNKFYERWSCTNVLNEILKHKKILREPRHAEELDSLMQTFYQAIDSSAVTGIPGESVTGVLFLAVCRGKVSEGLDFADNYARIVITVGIPFPNVKDTQVILKKSYNDKHKKQKGLLSGRDWYQIQAFRALNQALGRCIRHRNDWGAILLVDGRFSNQSYNSSLSKWIRNRITHHHTWDTMIQNLELFMRYRLSTTE